MNKAKLLANLKELAHEQYENSIRTFETITFLRDILGNTGKESTITLSDNGVCGLRNILDDLAAKAEIAACNCIYSWQLDELAGMAGDTNTQDQNKNPTHPENIQSRAFSGQDGGTDMDIYTPGGGHE